MKKEDLVIMSNAYEALIKTRLRLAKMGDVYRYLGEEKKLNECQEQIEEIEPVMISLGQLVFRCEKGQKGEGHNEGY